MDTLRDLELLIQSRYPIIAIETFEEGRIEEVLRRTAARLDIPFFVWTIAGGLVHAATGHATQETKHPAKALNSLREFKGEGIYLFKDLHRYLGDAETVRRLQDVARSFARSRSAIILSAPQIDVPDEIRELVAPFRLELPSGEELKLLAKEVLGRLSRQHRVKVELSDEEFDRLVESLKGFTLFEAERIVSRSVLLEYFPPQDGMDQIGGLKSLKAWLRKRSRAFTPEAKRFGITPPKGIFLLGVQGCGKSLAAKAVAREWGLPLLILEPGRLYDKFIGESEKNLERALMIAERMAPCVLMVDEIEKAFAYGGSAEADAGLSRRVFGRILRWMQDRKAPVVVVVDLPDAEDRKAIFSVHLSKRKRDASGFDLDALAAASEGFSGAEIEQAIVSGLYTAFAAGKELNTQHIIDEMRATKPLSVVRQEAIADLRLWAQDRTVMAG